jgi:hypothetical protein
MHKHYNYLERCLKQKVLTKVIVMPSRKAWENHKHYNYLERYLKQKVFTKVVETSKEKTRVQTHSGLIKRCSKRKCS